MKSPLKFYYRKWYCYIYYLYYTRSQSPQSRLCLYSIQHKLKVCGGRNSYFKGQIPAVASTCVEPMWSLNVDIRLYSDGSNCRIKKTPIRPCNSIQRGRRKTRMRIIVTQSYIEQLRAWSKAQWSKWKDSLWLHWVLVRSEHKCTIWRLPSFCCFK